MATTYGGRWKCLGSLGEGGQSHVFRVIDLTGQHSGEFALKRLRNPDRRQRFCNEIEAVKRLLHPNIIPLIDHSALDPDANEEKQFLVMPIAQGGDLGDPDRVALYHENLDSVLVVAKQLAVDLSAAHAANVIHRDIKPQNILLTGKGHEVWISDFGICLIREHERITQAGEVVGPRAFMAPELEDGGRLDVTPAADVYSLGKVIYYMLSGGVELPRERLHEPQFSRIFDKSERYRLMYLLLDRMIAQQVTQRIRTMEEVSREIERIDAWEQNARLLPISLAGLAAIEEMQRRAQDVQRIRSEDAATRDQEQQTLTSIAEGVDAWLTLELEKLVECIGGSAASGKPPNEGPNIIPSKGYYVGIVGRELLLQCPTDEFQCVHRLQIFLCRDTSMATSVPRGVGFSEPLQPARDLRLAFLPIYKKTSANQQSMTIFRGYFTKPTQTEANSEQLIPSPDNRWVLQPLASGGKRPSVEPVTKSFHAGLSQCFLFRAFEWPSCIEALRTALTEAVDAFLTFVSSGASNVGA